MNMVSRGVLISILLFATTVAIVDRTDARGIRIRMGGIGKALGKSAVSKDIKNYGSDVLSKEQLVACLRMELATNADADKIDMQDSKLEALKQHIESFSDELERLAARVDRYNQASVNRYNSQVESHRRMADEYNSLLPAYNDLIQANNAAATAFNRSCGSKRYYEDDMQEARLALGQLP